MSATRPAVRASGTVSPTSAQRFAAKVRGRRRRRVLVAVVAIAAVLAAGWGALLSPWATIRTVQVVRVGGPGVPGSDVLVPDAQIRAAAESELGHPLLLARTADVQHRLDALPLLRSGEVRRSWPGRLVLTVRERQAVAVVPMARGEGLRLVDRDGVTLAPVTRAPTGLPRLAVHLPTAGPDALRACLAMLSGLPPEVARRVRTIGATSADGIRLTLTDGSTVAWGDAGLGARKAQVLIALLPREAAHYDVTSPATPAIRMR